MKNKNSFTVIELLVVIAVIGFMASIIIVRVQGSREKARVAGALNFSHTLQNALGVDVVGIWKFDEGFGNTAYDSSGYNNHGVITGASYTDNTPQRIVGAAEGKYALSLSGSDYVEINNIAVNIEEKAYNTVEFWMYWMGGNSQMPIGWQQQYSLWLVDECFGFSTGQNNVLGVSWAGLNNKWTHVVAIFYNGKPSVSTVSLYLNGIKKEIYECRGSTNASRKVGPKLLISGWGSSPGYSFDGFIDELRVYNKSLIASQVETRYLAGVQNYLSYSQ